jgi:hypothetical protein
MGLDGSLVQDKSPIQVLVSSHSESELNVARAAMRIADICLFFHQVHSVTFLFKQVEQIQVDN